MRAGARTRIAAARRRVLNRCPRSIFPSRRPVLRTPMPRVARPRNFSRREASVQPLAYAPRDIRGRSAAIFRSVARCLCRRGSAPSKAPPFRRHLCRVGLGGRGEWIGPPSAHGRADGPTGYRVIRQEPGPRRSMPGRSSLAVGGAPSTSTRSPNVHAHRDVIAALRGAVLRPRETGRHDRADAEPRLL